jgi:hypothetical protein
MRHMVEKTVPILRVSAFDILFETQESRLRFVFSITHIPELLEIGFHILLSMLAAIPR